jgi:predicted GH43/DUF377 family glycosyl hydrolase
MDNFVKFVLQNGGSLKPIIIPSENTNGTGTFNPSIYNDNGNLYVNVRHCQVTLFHADKLRFESQWGPLIYCHPEDDCTLTTTNYTAKLNPDLSVDYMHKVDTSKFDVPSRWEFIGLEDGRFVKWDGKYYIIGVRRDTTPNGVGRMEYSGLDISPTGIKEISRSRIPGPAPDNHYCEKNWMAIVDMPYHFIRWTNPIQVVKTDPVTMTCEIVHQSQNKLDFSREIRGSSHVIPFDDGRLFITHEVDLWWDQAGRKNSVYVHRFFFVDKDWNFKKISETFNFVNVKIEFCAGLAEYGDDILISFGVQDNAAFILRCPKKIIRDFIYG